MIWLWIHYLFANSLWFENEFTIFSANSIWILFVSRMHCKNTSFFRKITLNSLSVQQLHYEFKVFYAIRLWVPFHFSNLLWINYKSIIYFAISQCIYFFWRIHYRFFCLSLIYYGVHSMDSLSFWLLNVGFSIFFVDYKCIFYVLRKLIMGPLLFSRIDFESTIRSTN